MSAVVIIAGEPYQYEVEATCGLTLATGGLWFGTHVRWRPGTAGRWHSFNIIDLHPMDSGVVDQAVRTGISQALDLEAERKR